MRHRINTGTAYPAPTAQLRASDTDRDIALARLGEAYAQGRITREEHAERVGAACRARTHGDLAQLLADLPESPDLTLVIHLADELLTEVARLGMSRGELAGLLALRS